MFLDTVDVYNALMKQVTNIIDKDYIKTWYNEISPTVNMTIPEVLICLHLPFHGTFGYFQLVFFVDELLHDELSLLQ